MDWVVSKLYGRGCGKEDRRSRGRMVVEMVRAVESRDYEKFRELYRGEYPGESESRIEEEYEWRVECMEDI